MRDAKHVMGFANLPSEMKGRPNKMALKALKRASLGHEEGLISTVEHPYKSWLWYFKQVKELERDQNFTFAVGTSCCFGGEREQWFAILNNDRHIQEALHKPHCPGHVNLKPYRVTRGEDDALHYDTSEEAEYPSQLCEAYATGLKTALAAKGWLDYSYCQGCALKLIPQLATSTARLAEETLVEQVAWDVAKLEADMLPGGEHSHLQMLARNASIRGTDLRLIMTSDSAQEFPYPAYRWHWHEVLCYNWISAGHINELELVAYFAMVKRRARTEGKHSI